MSRSAPGTALVARVLRLGQAGSVGAEPEWFAHDVDDPRVRPPLPDVAAALLTARLPAGGLLPTEPGGQVRVRGRYELRYLDGLPDPLWQVSVAAYAERYTGRGRCPADDVLDRQDNGRCA